MGNKENGNGNGEGQSRTGETWTIRTVHLLTKIRMATTHSHALEIIYKDRVLENMEKIVAELESNVRELRAVLEEEKLHGSRNPYT